MKNIIFIDTNIYLRFYDSNAAEYKNLLKSLCETSDVIFITQQIVDETCRNKMDVFLASMNEYIKQFGLSKISLPEHLETNEQEYIKKWNAETKELNIKSDQQTSNLKEIVSSLIKDISYNEDEVSKQLLTIFKRASIPNEANLEKARIRKELGNPPGKKNDPIGDELSWEQLLSNIHEVEELWIISNDSDYLLEFNKQYHLNPFLRSELLKYNPKLKINSFKTLSEGLSSYNKKIKTKIKTLPSEKLLNEITNEEKSTNYIDASQLYMDFLKKINSENFNYSNLKSIDDFKANLFRPSCPNCGGTLVGNYIKNKKQSNVTQELYCSNCRRFYSF